MSLLNDALLLNLVHVQFSIISALGFILLGGSNLILTLRFPLLPNTFTRHMHVFETVRGEGKGMMVRGNWLWGVMLTSVQLEH